MKQATKSNESNDIYQVMKKKFNTLKKKLLLQPLIKQETLKITNFDGSVWRETRYKWLKVNHNRCYLSQHHSFKNENFTSDRLYGRKAETR